MQFNIRNCNQRISFFVVAEIQSLAPAMPVIQSFLIFKALKIKMQLSIPISLKTYVVWIVVYCILSFLFFPPLKLNAEPATKISPVRPPRQTSVFSAKVFVKDILFTGNTLFSDKILLDIAAPYKNKTITIEELDELRQKLTDLYTRNGYINSGAVIPDQKVVQGIIMFKIIEGRISNVEVSTDGRLQLSYIKKRLTFDPDTPLNIDTLYEKFQLFHLSPVIKRIKLEVSPGLSLGESIIQAAIEEERPWQMGIDFNNHRSPSVGEERGQISFFHQNVTGWGDAVDLKLGLTRGMDDLSIGYTLPVTSDDTTLSLWFEKNDSEVIEAPFDVIDITGKSYTWKVTVKHPFYRRPKASFFMGMDAELRHSKTTLLGYPHAFSPGVNPLTGESDVTVIRFFQEWFLSSSSQVFAIRSSFSKGINAFDSTINSGEPDSRFFSWLFQFQWARRFKDFQESQLIFKTNFQISEDPLLSIEKFSVGGANTVRGYRENQFVRDNGVISSIEFRIPIFNLSFPSQHSNTPTLKKNLQLAPFFDFGKVWNKKFSSSKANQGTDAETIYSTGAGILWDPMKRLHAEVYFGWTLKDVEYQGDTLQDHGVHFSISYNFF